MPGVISWTWNNIVPLAPEIQRLTVGAVGLCFISGVKFTRKSPQNAFNVSYSFQLWKVSEGCKAMYPFQCTGICLPKLEATTNGRLQCANNQMSLNTKAFFFLCMSYN